MAGEVLSDCRTIYSRAVICVTQSLVIGKLLLNKMRGVWCGVRLAAIFCFFAQLPIVFKKRWVADVAVLHVMKVWLTYGLCNGLKTGGTDRIEGTVAVSTVGEYGTSRVRFVHRF